MFGVNEKPLAPQALGAKPELEMAGRNWMLVEGVEVYSTVQSLKVWRLWVPTTRDSHTEFSTIFGRGEPLFVSLDQENTKDGVVQ